MCSFKNFYLNYVIEIISNNPKKQGETILTSKMYIFNCSLLTYNSNRNPQQESECELVIY